MIQGLLSDPSFIPVTIVFSLFVLFAYWQELNKYVIHLSIVYAAFILFTAISYSDYDQVDEKDTFVNKDSSEEVLLSEDTSRVKDDDLNLESSSDFAIKEYNLLPPGYQSNPSQNPLVLFILFHLVSLSA